MLPLCHDFIAHIQIFLVSAAFICSLSVSDCKIIFCKTSFPLNWDLFSPKNEIMKLSYFSCDKNITTYYNWFIFFYGNTKIICHLCVVSGNDFFFLFSLSFWMCLFSVWIILFAVQFLWFFSSDFDLETRNLANMIKDKPSKNPPSFLSTVDP